MATYRGPYVSVGAGQSVAAEMVVTLSYPGGSLTADDTSATVNWSLRLRKNSGSGSANDTSSWSVTGDESASGSKSWSLSGSGSVTTIASGTDTVALSFSGGSWDVTGKVNHNVLPGAPSVSVSHTIPKRPVNAPAPVTNLSASRTSDSRQTLSWTRNATTQAPYTSIEIRRLDQVNSYATIATPGGSASSYTDSTTRADRHYRYAVRPVNSAGRGAWAYVEIDTTPAAPWSPGAAKSPSGDVVVTVRGLSSVATGWRVWDRPNGGAAVLVSGSSPLPASQSTWTHAGASPSQTHAYQVQAVSSSPVLYSALGPVSATIQLQAPPAAPTSLAPSAADATEAVVLTWQHNPVDTAAQSAYEIEHRATSADPWTSLVGKTTSGTSSRTVAAGTWANGGPVRWRVRTWAAHEDPSPWSAERVTTLSARPVAGITSPPSSWPSQLVDVTWTYFDEESSAMSGWEAQLRSSGGAVLASRSGTGAAYMAAFTTTPLDDGGSYVAAARVRDGSGLWSQWAEQPFTVSYAPPPTPTLDAAWHRDDGFTTLAVDVPDPVGVERTVASLRIERATPSGWVDVPGTAGLTSWPTTVTDMTPPLGQAVTYRAVATSTIGSEAYSETVAVETRTRWVFLNFGPGFGQVVRVYGNLQAGRTFGREKTLHRFVGRTLPVERSGGHVTRTYSLTARLFAPWQPPDLTSSWDDVEALGDAPAPVCVRDPEGVRMFCSVGDVSLDGHLEGSRTASIPLTAVDWDEP